MIYRNWSLLSSTVVIWGSVATAGLAGIFLFGGKVVPSAPIAPVEAPNPNRPCSPAVSFPESYVCIASPSTVASHVYEVVIVPAFAVVRFVVGSLAKDLYMLSDIYLHLSHELLGNPISALGSKE
ncbi:hypothetical protein PR202_ga18333 [Eleusine coracana subsp. coracana]|uniref:Uncharacterized protein n=1 Tax=Eleusine coracana subsp. coracana TaxID=191504 RepID=A0AAV5CRK8_ELECO|nr:hypothetical protein PR202_ga18333 [Eleusine coracana subsp. coracana]